MHPVLTIQAAPGLLYLNGRFCGEADAGGWPLARNGTAYVEYRPFGTEGAEALAFKCRLREGVLEGDLPPQAYAVQWPDGRISLELHAEQTTVAEVPSIQAQLALDQGTLYAIAQDGLAVGYGAGDQVLLPLPDGARATQFRMLSQTALPLCALEGTCGQDAFIAVLSAESPVKLFHTVTGCNAEIAEDGIIRTVCDEGDVVGHALLQVHVPDAQGQYSVRRQERAWLHGAPRWPQTPADTARAWLEAMVADNVEEARGYMVHPEQAAQWQRLLTGADAVVALPHPLPGSSQIEWGVLRVVDPQLARVQAVGFTLMPQQHAQGSWRIAEAVLHDQAKG